MVMMYERDALALVVERQSPTGKGRNSGQVLMATEGGSHRACQTARCVAARLARKSTGIKDTQPDQRGH